MVSMADQMGLGPKREVTRHGDGYLIKVTPPAFAGGFKGASVFLTVDQYSRYQSWRTGKLQIQDALPDLSTDDREILMSGLGPEDWKRATGDEE
jgi:hypothetical protein